MIWRATPVSLTPRNFEIRHDPLAGFYLSVFEGVNCVADYLQDSLELAMDMAFEDYAVPRNAWEKDEIG
jgi:hypothetical protein